MYPSLQSKLQRFDEIEPGDWSSDVCSSDLAGRVEKFAKKYNWKIKGA